MEIIHRYLPQHNSKKPNLKNPIRPPTSRHFYEIDSLKGGGSKETRSSNFVIYSRVKSFEQQYPRKEGQERNCIARALNYHIFPSRKPRDLPRISIQPGYELNRFNPHISRRMNKAAQGPPYVQS